MTSDETPQMGDRVTVTMQGPHYGRVGTVRGFRPANQHRRPQFAVDLDPQGETPARIIETEYVAPLDSTERQRP